MKTRALSGASTLALAFLIGLAPAQAGQLSSGDFNKLKKRLAMAAQQGNVTELERAADELISDDSERAVELLLGTAMAVPQGKVFGLVTNALARMTGDEATEAMVKTIEKRSGHPGAKILCIDALARRSDHRSGEALGAALSDRRPEVIRAALTAIQQRKATQAVDALIDLYGSVQGKDTLLQTEVEDALKAITGQYFDTVADWKKFWAVAKDRPQTGGSALTPVTTSERSRDRPTFFGSEIASNRLVFVIDVSGSMEGDRLQKMKDALKACIDALGPQPAPRQSDDGGGSRTRGDSSEARRVGRPTSRFTIVSYSNVVKVWEQNLQLATPKAIEKAKAFVDGLKATGTTFTLTAMLQAFEVQGADAIVLLSDGMPTETNDKGEMIGVDEIMEKIDGTNRFKKWRVDTFGFAGAGVDAFMKQLAEKHGGTYTVVH